MGYLSVYASSDRSLEVGFMMWGYVDDDTSYFGSCSSGHVCQIHGKKFAKGIYLVQKKSRPDGPNFLLQASRTS